jgi:hypothetical protein
MIDVLDDFPRGKPGVAPGAQSKSEVNFYAC